MAAVSDGLLKGVMVMFNFEGDPTVNRVIRIVSKEGAFPEITATFLPISEGIHHPLLLKVVKKVGETTGEIVELPTDSLERLELERWTEGGQTERSPITVNRKQIESLKPFREGAKAKKGEDERAIYQLVISSPKPGQFKGVPKRLFGERLSEAYIKGIDTTMVLHVQKQQGPHVSVANLLSSEPPEDLTKLSIETLMGRLKELQSKMEEWKQPCTSMEEVLQREEQHSAVMKKIRCYSTEIRRKLDKEQEALQRREAALSSRTAK